MNYGKFFRLNRSLSKIEEGIAIYDYVDLPAYFTPSVENHLSPKYPISVNISQSSVSFRLHYCAFKIEGQKDNLENYTYYKYDSDNFKIEKEDKYKSGDDIKVAHMEEVILELPFVENATSTLSDIIKDIYMTNFPQMIGGSTSTGGRFLEQLIHKRYPKSSEWRSIEELKKEGDTEALLYGTLREASDDSPSYSTLWLMDLIKDVEGEKDKKRIDLYTKQKVKDDETGKERKIDVVTGFLRKLLLDFMFDLRHSDVFQNSANYQKMYSGLMSDFYFSALMHKCEYYYCRKLILKEIRDCEKMLENKQSNTIEKKNSIKILYANNLYKAEQIWVNDIISPQAEKDFDFLYPQKNDRKLDQDRESEKQNVSSKIKLFLIRNGVIKLDQFRSWDSWFAPPEEEMKRVCFGMKEEGSPKIHTCNTDNLAEYFQIYSNDINEEDKDKKLVIEMRTIGSEIRANISRWFLRRYDFHDTAYLHLSKYSNWALTIGLVLLILLLFFMPCIVTPDSPKVGQHQHYYPLAILLLCLLVGYYFFSCAWNWERRKINCKENPLINKSYILSKWRVKTLFAGLAFLLVFINSYIGMAVFLVVLLGGALLLNIDLIHQVRFILNRVITNLHLLFPRLVASITTAWLTLTLGFDLYSSFFDKSVSWPTAFFVSIVILMFIMFEINQITPRVSLWKKTLRSLELFLISWCISILVGIVVIDFVGERYLERGGYIENHQTEYIVGEEGVETLVFPDEKRTENKTRTKMVDDLTKYKPIVLKFYLGEHEVFYMRDFLFMFSFITMFMGIFLQMFIFDDKKMTEF